MKLIVDYCPETDTLSIWNGTPASSGADVSEDLIADLDAEGNAVGFTLEHAAELLSPLLTPPVLNAPAVGANNRRTD